MKREEKLARGRERCWSVIGVLGGDRSCPVLLEVAHCRECEVLALAAHTFLAGMPVEPSPTVFLRSSREGGPVPPADRIPPIVHASSADGSLEKPFSVITFEVGGQSLALEARRVVEVGEARPVRRVPHRTSPAFSGLVNVQGRLEPCFSLSAVLGLPQAEDDAERRLLVIGDEKRRCAFQVTRVALREADLALVGDPPATVSAALDTHIRGILRLGDRPWAWLDADRLLASLERVLR